LKKWTANKANILPKKTSENHNKNERTTSRSKYRLFSKKQALSTFC